MRHSAFIEEKTFADALARTPTRSTGFIIPSPISSGICNPVANNFRTELGTNDILSSVGAALFVAQGFSPGLRTIQCTRTP